MRNIKFMKQVAEGSIRGYVYKNKTKRGSYVRAGERLIPFVPQRKIHNHLTLPSPA